MTQSEKQERRGGIETYEDMDELLKELVGSRNAVVALKPKRAQELQKRHFPEAGTPWWH